MQFIVFESIIIVQKSQDEKSSGNYGKTCVNQILGCSKIKNEEESH